jgi:farnesyl diphosphate synthase
MAAEFARWRERVETNLARAIDDGACETRLRDAMRHATLGAGKRIRALLAYAAGEACGADAA